MGTGWAAAGRLAIGLWIALPGCAIDAEGRALDDAGRPALDAGTDAAALDGGRDAGLDGAVTVDAGDDAGPIDAALCDPPRLLCGSECVDPTSDPGHCGGCDACPSVPGADATCAGSVCGFSCRAGFRDCDTMPGNGCEIEVARDPANCGACGMPCPSRFGVTPGCSAGICTYLCAGGLFDCDGIEANGCEVDPRADVLHCGGCDPCPSRAGTVASCAMSTCAWACDASHLDCNMDLAADGCEASVLDVATCGACATDCRTGAPAGTTPTCTVAGCTYPCDGTHIDCDGARGCEVDPRSDVMHCGGCGACPLRAHATASCTMGACGYECVAPWGDCDGNPANGCETDTTSAPANCGMCGRICSAPPAATATCAMSACGFDCTPGRGNCDGDATNGCETNVTASTTHCGMCGMACPARAFATTTCASSTCGFTCNAGRGDCDGTPTNGCETDTTATLAHCGGCGMGCATRPNTSVACTGSACSYMCTLGFTDCNMLPGDGCEVDLASDALNCGMCGRACPPGRTCSLSACHGWTPTTDVGGPSARHGHTAIWTGTRMIVWGGTANDTTGLGDGASYDPMTNSWTALPAAGAPSARWGHTAVWTGTEMIVWGGWNGTAFLNDGARYNPATGAWGAVTTSGALSARARHVAVWGGTRMIAWSGATSGGGGDAGDGSRYTPPPGEAWAGMGGTDPGDRRASAAVWSGTVMFAWGGETGGGTALGNGGRYDLGMNTWFFVSSTGAPSARARHSIVWAPPLALVWGGDSGAVAGVGTPTASGARYNPGTNAWSAMLASPLAARTLHTAVWTGTEMIVWGGYAGTGPGLTPILGDGAAYRPGTDRWGAITDAGAPSPRYDHTAVWTGAEMIVWGGVTATGVTATGGRFVF